MSAVHDDRGTTARRVDPYLIRPLGVEALDAVLAIEAAAYAFPWTRGNFIDSLAAGYLVRGRFAPSGLLVGYLVAMPGFEELHLLNLTVGRPYEGRGHGRALLSALYGLATDRGAHAIWLEVRESNERARALYRREGFVEAGRRRAYYPAVEGREDAILMTRATGSGTAPDGRPQEPPHGLD